MPQIGFELGFGELVFFGAGSGYLEKCLEKSNKFGIDGSLGGALILELVEAEPYLE